MTTPQEIVVEKPWLKVGCNLGEGSYSWPSDDGKLQAQPALGPVYDPTTSTLHFVDIGEKRVMLLIVVVLPRLKKIPGLPRGCWFSGGQIRTI